MRLGLLGLPIAWIIVVAFLVICVLWANSDKDKK